MANFRSGCQKLIQTKYTYKTTIMPSKDKKSTKKPTTNTVEKTAGKKARKTTAEPVSEIKHKFARLPRAPLLRQVKEMAKHVDPEARVQAQLLDRLEQEQQEHMFRLVSNTVRAAKNFNRKTMMVKDLEFVMDIQKSAGNNAPLGSSATAQATAAASN